jgi:RNA-directed DNA polymerase
MEEQQDDDLVRTMRQNTQLELAFPPRATGEARSDAAAATEIRTATGAPESSMMVGVTMEAVVARDNLRQALDHVRRNKGAPGIDGMTVDDLAAYLKEQWPQIRVQLLDGSYRPQPVRRVEIPKASGGTRALGIPTVLDRFIQQAVLEPLQAALDPSFSEASFGFRPGRSARQAVARAQEHIAAGHRWVVDLDLEKFFDRVNHDILMGLVAKRVEDRRLRRLIRGFLTAGVLADGLVSPTEEGTPQGGPLSPLLSNLMLNELDRELERRGHRFVRGACPRAAKRGPVGRRLQHLCSQPACGRAGDGERRTLPDPPAQAQAQRRQECGRPSGRAQVPGLQLHQREGAAAAHRAANARPLQEAGPRADAPNLWA